MKLFLLSGIPGSGKSHFGRWLEETHGYVHLDVEKDGCLGTYHLTEIWNNCFSSTEVGPFIKSLQCLGERVVVNWGFPPKFLNLVQRFKAGGLIPWWFNADQDVARRAFLARGDVPIQSFETQMAAIREQWSDIEATFCPNIITTLRPNGTRLSVKEIYKVMSESKGNTPPQ